MNITLLCSDVAHPINAHIEKWMQRNNGPHQIALVRRKSELPGGDVLFLVSCTEIVQASDRQAYKACLVLHASDLPRGRGWSPHVWAIIDGAEQITLTLLEAEGRVDSGRIWKKITFHVPRHALWDEINEMLFNAEMELIDFAVAAFDRIKPLAQAAEIEPTYHRRRTPADSRIDPNLSIADQFNQIRVCDPRRFPAYFDLHGLRYKLIVEKMDGQSDCN